MEAVLGPTGVLRFCEAVEEKPWVSVAICIMMAAAVGAGGLTGVSSTPLSPEVQALLGGHLAAASECAAPFCWAKAVVLIEAMGASGSQRNVLIAEFVISTIDGLSHQIACFLLRSV